MYLKRIFDHSSGKPVLSHIKVLRAGTEQKITPHLVEKLAAQGVLTLGGGKITLKTGEGEPDLVWAIVRAPGLYCCHCDAPQGDSLEAQAHVFSVHPETPSPDANNPAGYRKDNFYFCTRSK